jgi:protein gp37
MMNSKIEWTDHTWNPWTGCFKVSPGCANCFAERIASRFKRAEWGKDGARSFLPEKKWVEPLKWARRAAVSGEREKVFVGSMMDVFEDRADLLAARLQLFATIDLATSLDWLLVTKRPENIRKLLPESWIASPRANVWFLVSIETAEQSWRWTELSKVRAAVRGISYEPALGPLSLEDVGTFAEYSDWEGDPSVPGGTRHFTVREMVSGPDWIIAGSESGRGARPADFAWFEDLQVECEAQDVAFFCKQFHNGSDKESLPTVNGKVRAEYPVPRSARALAIR